MSLREDLYELERVLGDGDGDTYREHLSDDAVVVVPGRAMTKEETVAAMDASAGWDESSFDDERFMRIGDDTALLNYRFSGRRGDAFRYTALMGSLYVQRNGAWKMVYHQQTPLT
jgi:hypothetical protein